MAMKTETSAAELQLHVGTNKKTGRAQTPAKANPVQIPESRSELRIRMRSNIYPCPKIHPWYDFHENLIGVSIRDMSQIVKNAL